MSERTPEAIRTALEDLLHSEGWAILKEMVEQKHGTAAQVREIGKVFQGIAPSDAPDAQGVIVPQILAAAKAAFGVLDLPAAKLRAVKEAEQAAKEPRGFAALRRVRA